MSKRGPDGRFVAHLCELCEDEGFVGCGRCDGSGIGVTGPVEKSTCGECKGKGKVPCPGEVHWKGD